MLRVLALAHLDLAAPADPAAAADRVDVDPEAPRCVEDGRAGFELAAPPGGREDDEMLRQEAPRP